MLKSVIYMHRFQLNDASERCPRAAPKAHADLMPMPMIMLMPRRMTMTWASEEHSGRSPNPRRDESSRIESSRALKRLSRPQVKQTIKACKRENKGKMRIRMRRGENGESTSMKEMQLGAKE